MTESLFEDNYFFCPICFNTSEYLDMKTKKEDSYIEASGYLKEVFKDDEKTCWLANMITHYRHNHINYYNRANSNPFYLKNYDHDKVKVEQNERSKRQIIRKCRAFLIEHGITDEDFKRLQHTDSETIKLAEKELKIREVKLI